MTSEYENSLDLFENTTDSANTPAEEQKSVKRVVRRRSTEGTAQVVLRVKPVEAETQQEEEKPDKKRGRPPKKS